MRLSRRSEPFDSNDYIFEPKIDGFRSLAYLENGQCDLVSRKGNRFRSREYNQLQEAIREKPFFVLLDSMFCCPDVRSNP
jgi:bifunctional non-homologous end joining protein LigD